MNADDQTKRARGRGRHRAMWGAEHPGHGWGGGRRRMRRGDIRRAVLSVLEEEPAHGYEVMRRLEARSSGMWRPSPGSVYPLLQMLEDEGLVSCQARDGTRVYELTDAGRVEAAKGETDGRPPWERGDDSGGVRALREAAVGAMIAARMLSSTANPEEIDRAVEILDGARRDLYRLLAGD
jgi:DNA-binding PadR family transcriptional regulator